MNDVFIKFALKQTSMFMEETLSRPLFSIITVTYNAAETIETTMQSVAAQTFHLFEHIVIDGASTDETLSIIGRLKSEKTIIKSEPDRGIYDGMNKGMDAARGEYFIFLNSGDCFHSDETLQQIAETIMNNDFPGIVYGQTVIVNNEGKILAERHLKAPEQLTLKSFANGMAVCHQAFIAYRKITGPFNLRYRFSADYDWCVRCLQHSRRNVYIDDVLIDYLHEGTTTRNRRKSLKERFLIMKKYYGLLPTIGRHIKFIPRFIKRQRFEKTFK